MPDIKINADVSGIKKSINDISRTIKDLDRSPVSLLSAETVQLLKGEAKDQLDELRAKQNQIRIQLDHQTSAVKRTTRGTREYRQEMEKLVRLSKQLAQSNPPGGHRGPGGGAAGGAARGGGRGGGGFGGAAGLLGRVGIAGGLAGAGIAAAGYVGSRVVGGVNKFRQGIPSRLKLRGLGAAEGGNEGGFARAGLGPEEARQHRIQNLRAFGQGGDSASLGLAQSERGFGLESGQLGGLGGSLRPGVGGAGALEDIQKTMASAMTTGLNDADIGAYLETAVGYLQSIDESGIKDRSEMLAALSGVIKATGEAPEKIARGLGGIDSAISGSGGEGNAFFQQAFAKKGIGGGTIGGTQFAVEGGLSGLNLGRVAGLTGAQRGQLEGLQGGGAQKRAGAILDQFKSAGIDVNRLRSGKASQQEQVTGGRLAKSLFGTKTGAEGLGQLGLLAEVAKGGKGGQSAQQKLVEARKTVEEKSLDKLTKINNSLAGAIQVLEKIRMVNEETIGANAAGYYKLALKFLTGIDKGIIWVSDGLKLLSDKLGITGRKTQAEVDEEVKGAFSGSGGFGGVANSKIPNYEEIEAKEQAASKKAEQISAKISQEISSSKAGMVSDTTGGGGVVVDNTTTNMVDNSTVSSVVAPTDNSSSVVAPTNVDNSSSVVAPTENNVSNVSAGGGSAGIGSFGTGGSGTASTSADGPQTVALLQSIARSLAAKAGNTPPVPQATPPATNDTYGQ